MKLSELVRTNNWLSVELIFIELYSDQIENIDAHKEVFEKLQFIEVEESDITIELVQRYDDETAEESRVDVSGRRENTHENILTDSLAIEFVPWKEWLGMTISTSALAEFNELEIIAHCLYEMTFAGYQEEEIQEQFAALKILLMSIKV